MLRLCEERNEFTVSDLMSNETLSGKDFRGIVNKEMSV